MDGGGDWHCCFMLQCLHHSSTEDESPGDSVVFQEFEFSSQLPERPPGIAECDANGSDATVPRANASQKNTKMMMLGHLRHLFD